MPHLLTFPLLIILSLPAVASAQRTTSEAATSLPIGWTQAPNRLQNAALWQCAGYGGSWVVSIEGSIIKLARFNAESIKHVPLPPQLKLSKKMIGRRSLERTSSGWLVGFDAGEFGGGLWWFSSDGSQTIELLSENVHAIYHIEKSILILTGLNHMGSNYGHIYKFDDTFDKATVTSVADLGGSPEASTVDSGNNMVVAARDRILQVDKNGKISEMYKIR